MNRLGRQFAIGFGLLLVFAALYWIATWMGWR